MRSLMQSVTLDFAVPTVKHNIGKRTLTLVQRAIAVSENAALKTCDRFFVITEFKRKIPIALSK